MENQDKPLSEDIAEQKREVQVEIDTNIRLRGELAASNSRLSAMDAQIAAGSEESRGLIGTYLAQYLNPTQPNPTEPLAPEVAQPAPAEEPPVFTDVASVALGGDAASTSGGSSLVAEAFELPPIGDSSNAGNSEAG